jgi:hypothetical protein
MTSTRNMAKHGGQGQYRSDQFVSMSDSNVFSLTEKGEDNAEFATIFSPNSDLVVGFGTSTPSSRLSLGKNTTNVSINEVAKNSIPGICFNEESNGTDATGIRYFERFDNVTGERAEAGIAFLVSNENYIKNSDSTFTNTLDTSNKNIPVTILSRSTGQNTMLINHNPANTTSRAVFSNDRVSLDISGALRTSQFVILGINSDLLQSTDFNILNNGALLFDGLNLYIKQVGIDVPTQILLRNDAQFGTTTEFQGFGSDGSTLGIYQPTQTLFGATMSSGEENIFRNALSVAGNLILGNKPYINHIVNIFNGDPTIPTPGIISVQNGIGINVFDIKAAIEIGTQNRPYIIIGDNNTRNDISSNAIVCGDNNSMIDYKCISFGDNNNISGNASFNIGDRNISTGNNCFIRGDDNQNISDKSIIFGDLNILVDNDRTTSNNHKHTNIFGIENQLTDCSNTSIFGSKTDISNSDHSFVIGYNNTISNSNHSFAHGSNNTIINTNYSVGIGYNSLVTGTNRFAFGTFENSGNVFTIDQSGNIITEGDIFCLVNKSKGIYENCDHNITIGNSNSITIVPGEFANYSDVRLKENIKTIHNSLHKVCRLRGVNYNRKDSNDNKIHMGLIAQEVEQIIPEVVNKNMNNGYLSVSYGNIVAVLIESVKELNTKVNSLENENNTLKSDMEIIKTQMKKVLSIVEIK